MGDLENDGFTLIEMMIVISIIGILAAVAMPNFMAYRNKTYTLDADALFVSAKANIEEFYQERGRFPKNNKEAGLLEPEKIQSNFVSSLEVENGAVHIMYSNRVDDDLLKGYTVTYRPSIFTNNPVASIAWVCGYQESQEGFLVMGQNRTNFHKDAPTSCK